LNVGIFTPVQGKDIERLLHSGRLVGMQEERIVAYRSGHRSCGVRHWLPTMKESQVILCEVHGDEVAWFRVFFRFLVS
jgi:hypothetical protein